ncbi:MAG: LrgB family protein [Rhodospirillaceae bacterium]
MVLDHPLLFPALTLGVYAASAALYEKTGKPAILQPVLVSVIVLGAVLAVLGIPTATYAADMDFFVLLLTPAIVALAVPLYQNLQQARDSAFVLAMAILVGGSLILLGALGLSSLAGLEPPYLLPMLTKSVSAPIAISIAEQTDAVIALTILAVFSTGLPGSVLVPGLLKLFRLREEALQGLVLGITCHAFGIARAVEISPRATAFATLGMGLMGCFVALTVPTLAKLLGL